jgi:hypothetical protein
MANKSTVTMYHPKASSTIEVLPGGVKTAEASGWTTEKPVDEKSSDDVVHSEKSAGKEKTKSKKKTGKSLY